jgi:hypothetical protein
MVGIAFATSIYTRRLLKRYARRVEEESFEERSEAARGLLKLSSKNPDYRGAVEVIRDEAIQALSRHKGFDSYYSSLSAFINRGNYILNKETVSKEKFIEVQSAFLRLSAQRK